MSGNRIIYFREDLARVLSHVDMSSEGETALVDEEIETASQNGQQLDQQDLVERLRLYRRGYEDALAAVARAWGITPATWVLDRANDDEDYPIGLANLVRRFQLLTWEL